MRVSGDTLFVLGAFILVTFVFTLKSKRSEKEIVGDAMRRPFPQAIKRDRLCGPCPRFQTWHFKLGQKKLARLD